MVDQAFLLDRIEKSEGHWIPRQKPNNAGYVMIRDETGKKVGAHVLAYRLWKGEIPEGWMVDHAKGCPRTCCNPSHLKAVPRAENGRLYMRRRTGQMSRRELRAARWLHKQTKVGTWDEAHS